VLNRVVNLRTDVVNYSVPQVPTAPVQAESPSERRAHTDLQPRWPLFLSIFGALAVSLLLWAGIIWGVSLAIAWVNGAS